MHAGVVKDQLNEALKPLSFFFAPDLSTSGRATVCGMISSDASGQGFLVYVKTNDHTLALTSVIADGTILITSPMGLDEAKTLNQKHTPLAKMTKQLLDTCLDKRQQIKPNFLVLTGFNWF